MIVLRIHNIEMSSKKYDICYEVVRYEKLKKKYRLAVNRGVSLVKSAHRFKIFDIAKDSRN